MCDLHSGGLQRLQPLAEACVNWREHARLLATQVTHPASRWRAAVEEVPRHVFVPRWWSPSDSGTPDGEVLWELRDGSADPSRWLEAAYSDRSLVTQVGLSHADQAVAGDHPAGMPTSSSTMPGLIVRLGQHAHLTDNSDVLDVGTGSGYGCALLVARLDAEHVTSVDVDPYLTAAACERLDSVGLRPTVLTVDATGNVPGTYDRIIATVAVRPVPASWLAGLRPGGRLVTTIAGTGLILTADKTDDGGALGRIEWDRAGFMLSRHGPGYPPPLWEQNEAARDGDGEQVNRGWYPVLNVMEAWELWSMITVLVPGVEHYYREEDGGRRTAWMLHPDGSWARASAVESDPPVVHQSGARRLWDLLDEVREMWLREGSLPVYGASATITPDGGIHLRRGRWRTSLNQEATDDPGAL
jgi:protein-L-isoaspartate O-methyltransferase